MAAEHDLWSSVLQQAFYDSVMPDVICYKNNVRPNPKIMYKSSAKRFLTKNASCFKRVCALAGLDPEWVMQKYKLFNEETKFHHDNRRSKKCT